MYKHLEHAYQIDWNAIAPEVAVRLKGEPRTKSDKEWRWGTKGSFALYLEKGKFSDYKNGVAALVGWVEPKAKIYAFE